MTHLLVGLVSPIFWFFAVSAALLGSVLVVELVQHRRMYLSDGWAETGMMEEGVAPGPLALRTHVTGTEHVAIEGPGQV